jgi:hypothetical protein
VFFLPQLVQLLRGDDGAISSFFLTTARHSDLFAHNLMWALASESRPPEEAFNPEVKRWVWQCGAGRGGCGSEVLDGGCGGEVLDGQHEGAHALSNAHPYLGFCCLEAPTGSWTLKV